MQSEAINSGSPLAGRTLALLAIVVLVTVADQATKWYAVENWKDQPPQSFFHDVFRIQYAPNTGAFLSLLADAPPMVRYAVLVVVNGAVLVGLAGFLLWAKRLDRWTFTALALVVAGGVGNLIDRIRLDYVIDFWNLGLGDLRTGIFNVADMAITAAFIMMAPVVFRREDAAREPGIAPTAEHPTS